MTAKPSGMNITPSRLSFWLAIVAALTVIWQAVSYAEDQRFRLEAVETYIAEQRSTNKELNQSINELSLSVTRLTTLMESLPGMPATKAAAKD